MNIKNIFFLLVLIVATSCSSHQASKTSEWTNLLDENLSLWSIYQSYESMASNGKPVEGTDTVPIGYDINKHDLFTVIKEADDELVLHVNGKTYGCVFTKESYRNYHLKLQYKFGAARYAPREDKASDSGIIYHSQGESGVDYWHSWMLGQEFQVLQGGTDEGVSGDYWSIATAQVWIKASNDTSTNSVHDYFYNQEAELLGFGAHSKTGHCGVADYTSPGDEWTTLELICFEGKSLHIVNGNVVMALEKSSYWNGVESLPLVEGKIQLQSESAEVFYKNILIKEINEFPSEYEE